MHEDLRLLLLQKRPGHLREHSSRSPAPHFHWPQRGHPHARFEAFGSRRWKRHAAEPRPLPASSSPRPREVCGCPTRQARPDSSTRPVERKSSWSRGSKLCEPSRACLELSSEAAPCSERVQCRGCGGFFMTCSYASPPGMDAHLLSKRTRPKRRESPRKRRALKEN